MVDWWYPWEEHHDGIPDLRQFDHAIMPKLLTINGGERLTTANIINCSNVTKRNSTL